MRLYSHILSFILFMGAFSFAPAHGVSGQIGRPGGRGAAQEDLPDAPVPQSVPSAEPVDQQSATGQNRSGSAIAAELQDDARPDSSIDPFTAHVHGTVTDVNGDIVPGAAIVLEGESVSDRQTVVAGSSGAFQFDTLKPGMAYHVTISAGGFEDWKSPAITLRPGQYLLLSDIRLKLPVLVASVVVSASQEQIATEQVTLEEHQRVLGIFPNFYVSYDPDAVPLTTRLKFRLAYKADTDAVTFVGVAFMATMYQAGDIPDYGQGWDAYGKRVAAGYGDTTSDIFLGGAVLPWLLHQDPRYFYQGTGTKKSRARHAIFSPFVCRGDNGKSQPNFSSIGGDLASGAISNLYYPDSNRGAGLVFQGFLVTTGVRMVNGLIQEFVLRELTPSARKRN